MRISAFCTITVLTGGVLLQLPYPAQAAMQDGILVTKHNLSAGGPGPIKAASEQQVCIFCHTPHHASQVTPLWSREESTTVYDLYSSSTRFAKPGQPTGSSRLCLSCHDGTIAVGALINQVTIPMAGGYTTIPQDRPTNLGGSQGKNLTNDHPISFQYSPELVAKNHQLRLPTLIPAKLKLDADKNLQCTTCHNPHNNPYGKFLVMDPAGSALCVGCHNQTGWEQGGHYLNAATSVNGCGNCHVAHNAKIAPRLMKETPEEQNCAPCHSGTGSGKNVFSLLGGLSAHKVNETFGVHDDAENPLSAARHVECEDCHNPHAANGAAAVAPYVNGRLSQVRGVAMTGEVKTATYEYEVCLKCHGDNNFSSTVITRQVATLNTRLEFSPGNPSFHPVMAQGRGDSVPSLRTDLGYSTSSVIYCSDCHGSDQSVKAGGSGPNGPHGSSFKYMLLQRYDTEFYPLSYSESNYALCYRCHNKDTLFTPTSPFYAPAKNLALHDVHVKQQGVGCFICHDPHGVSSGHGGTVQKNAHLINFVTNFGIVASYDSTALPKSCTSSCHSGNPRTYGPGSSAAKVLGTKRPALRSF
ncbi:cytochrome C [Geomonas oryzisoli]|uniref:Cytochrome C n=1 Tax=Geomonas oryzisoli TaxID=2847992 RepID=A0ABX8J252_9BACT|nr:cytochrome c3 family protein [Geomonas oryzisoli]QWV92408.1 cytochrome C [Geomonas oryzisoli]